jgi:hypothetical protein
MTAVSDSVVLSMPFSEPTCAYSLMALIHILQCELIDTNFRMLSAGATSTLVLGGRQ